MSKRSLLLAAALLTALPTAAEAQRRPSTVTYLASSGPSTNSYGPPFQVAAVTIRGGTLVTSVSWYTQPFTGFEQASPNAGIPTLTSGRNIRISSKGTFTLPIPLPRGSGPSSPTSTAGGCLLGTLKRNKLTLSGYGTANGGNDGPESSCSIAGFYGQSLTVRTGPLRIVNGTYSGSTTGMQMTDPDGPYGPVTGPQGTLSLTLVGGDVAGGTGSFLPQDPTTGATVSGAQVPVTYGSAAVSNTTGVFQLPSTPEGYDLCGAVLPNGTIGGLAQCEQSSWLASTFSLTNSG